jgi:lipoyl synthase
MERIRKPDWLKSNKLGSRKTQSIAKFMREHKLHTVCENAKCPNLGECFERGTATFLILGDICTRKCAFCAVKKNVEQLSLPAEHEPESIALFCQEANLQHAVITSVTRDDLEDEGAGQFIKTIRAIRKTCDSSITI